MESHQEEEGIIDLTDDPEEVEVVEGFNSESNENTGEDEKAEDDDVALCYEAPEGNDIIVDVDVEADGETAIDDDINNHNETDNAFEESHEEARAGSDDNNIEVVDLLDEKDSDESAENAVDSYYEAPIGNDISVDVVDLENDDGGSPAVTTDPFLPQVSNGEKPKPFWAQKRRTSKSSNSSETSKKPKLKAAPKNADAQSLEDSKPQAMPAPGSIGGINYIVIDDDVSENEDEEPRSDTTSGEAKTTATQQSNSAAPRKNVDYAMRESTTTNIHRPKKRKRGENSSRQPQPRPASHETIRDFGGVRASQKTDRYDQKKYYSYYYSQEDAQEMQDRMFREAAARVRVQLENEQKQKAKSTAPPEITTALPDIEQRHPHHWKWKDPHACLGLPPNASLAQVKSQYRRLARLYHPDKSSLPYSAKRFHGIATAYRKLTDMET